MHAQIAEEEGLFTMDDVIRGVTEKMIRRHPHVFGDEHIETSGAVLDRWEEIKKKEKAEKAAAGGISGPDEMPYLFEAFREAEALIGVARKRKERKLETSKEKGADYV